MKKQYLLLLALLITVTGCTTNSSSNENQSSILPSSSEASSNSLYSSEEMSSQPPYSSIEEQSSSTLVSSEISSSSEVPSSSETVIQRFTQISNVYDLIFSLTKNNKGTVTGDTIILTAQYVEKLDSSIALFSDGSQVIQVYGDKINNGLTLGTTYDVTAVLAVYLHKPNLNYVSHVKRNDIDVVPPVLTANQTVTAQTIKAYGQTQGEHFPYVYHFEGYILMKTWSANWKYALADSLNAVVYDSNAKRNDTLYIKNHDENTHDVLLEQPRVDEVKISVDFVMYGYNTLYFTWQVHMIDNTFSLLPF